MTTIRTTTTAAAMNGSRMILHAGAYQYAVIHVAESTRYEFWVSSDDGASWTEVVSARLTVSGSPLGTPTCATAFLDDQLNIWLVYGNAQGYVYVNVASITYSGGLTNWSGWHSSTIAEPGQTGGVAVVVTALDAVAAIRYIAPLYYSVVSVVWQTGDGRVGSSSKQYRLLRYVGDTFAPGVSQYQLLTNSGLPGSKSVALDFQHNGNGRTMAYAGKPNLFMAYRETTATMFRKQNWKGTGSTLYDVASAARTLKTSAAATTDPLTGAFDGTRFNVAFTDNSSHTAVQWYERNADDTSTVARTPVALSDGNVTSLSATYDGSDSFLFAVGTTSDDVKRARLRRSTGTFDAWDLVATASAVDGSMTAQRAWNNGGFGVVWNNGSGSPLTVTYQRSGYNDPPYAPTWTTAHGAGNVAAPLSLTWTFNDPNSTDTQSAYALSGQWNGGATTYFNAGTGTFGGTEVKNVSTAGSASIPSWGVDNDSVIFKVKTWDGGDLVGAYSVGLNITGSGIVNPTITAPVTDATTTASSIPVTWTVAEQTAYRVRILSAGGGTLYDSGRVTTTATTMTPDFVLPNGLVDAQYEVRTWNADGLESATSSATGIDVTYTVPATPTYLVTPVPAAGYMNIAITDPTPSGGQPPVTGHDVFVRVAEGGRPSGDRPVGGDGIRIAVNVLGEFRDYAAGAGIDYQYRTLAMSATGAVTYGAWSSAGTAAPLLTEYGEPIYIE